MKSRFSAGFLCIKRGQREVKVQEDEAFDILEARLANLEDGFCPVCCDVSKRSKGLEKAGQGFLSQREIKSIDLKRKARFNQLKMLWQEAKNQGMSHKIWQIVAGPNVRISHKAANWQRVAIDDHFRIGNEQMFLPADPSASFLQTANCRCEVKYEKREALNSLQASRIAFGEFGAFARKEDGSIPAGLADAVASVFAVCQRGNPCASVDGSQATNLLDIEAWRNIRRAVGGIDKTRGADLMCVGDDPCRYVHSAFTYVRGVKKLVKRPKPLPLRAKLSIIGSWSGDKTLYFYKLPYKGWLKAEDLRYNPKELE